MMLASRSPDSFGHFLGGIHENHPIYAFCRLDDLAKHRFGVLSDEHLAAQLSLNFAASSSRANTICTRLSKD
jgi:hypothetical protein